MASSKKQQFLELARTTSVQYASEIFSSYRTYLGTWLEDM